MKFSFGRVLVQAKMQLGRKNLECKMLKTLLRATNFLSSRPGLANTKNKKKQKKNKIKNLMQNIALKTTQQSHRRRHNGKNDDRDAGFPALQVYCPSAVAFC